METHRASRVRAWALGGRSIWGSGYIPEHRYLTTSQLSRSTGTTILVINDTCDFASTLRSCNMTVRAVALEDTHIRHEILTNITEGAVMGAIV